MDEMATIRMVEVCDTFTSKLQVLLLVMADGHMSSPCGNVSVTGLVWEKHCQAYRWTRMSAACSTGYENKPSFNREPTDRFSSVEDEARLSLL